MVLHICICDDRQPIHDTIEALLRQNEPDADAYTLTHLFTGEALSERYARGERFDLVFLDIELGGMDGIDTAKVIRCFDEDAILVFVSAHRKYVFDAFPFGALHYLVKPIEPAAFADVYRRAVQRYRDLHASIAIRCKNERHVLPVCKILWLEGGHRRVIFHTADGDLETPGKLSDHLRALQPHGFLRVHQAFAVNPEAVRTIERDRVLLENGDVVYISQRRRAEALQAFDSYLGNRKW